MLSKSDTWDCNWSLLFSKSDAWDCNGPFCKRKWHFGTAHGHFYVVDVTLETPNGHPYWIKVTVVSVSMVTCLSSCWMILHRSKKWEGEGELYKPPCVVGYCCVICDWHRCAHVWRCQSMAFTRASYHDRLCSDTLVAIDYRPCWNYLEFIISYRYYARGSAN